MKKLINNGINTAGIFRGKLLDDNGTIRAYIPGIYSDELGTNISRFPEVQWCCYNIESKSISNIKGPAFIMFENGDITKPVCISYSVIGGGGSPSSNTDNSGGGGDIDIDGDIYPLEKRHTEPIIGSRVFGADRPGRAHAGVDLISPVGTKVIACTDGTVKYISDRFYLNTSAIVIKNTNGSWYLYGECQPYVKVGEPIYKGQNIGVIISNGKSSMLHFEAYKGYENDDNDNVLTSNGEYEYVPNNKIYYRRKDLIDPSFVANLPLLSEIPTKDKNDNSSGVTLDENDGTWELVGNDFTITHYCTESYTVNHPCNDGDASHTFTGTTPTPGRTIAVDPNVIPLNSYVKVNNHKYIAEDTGGAIKGHRIDICVKLHNEALQLGVKYNQSVYIFKKK